MELTPNQIGTAKRIGLGNCPAQRVNTLQVGDILIWNYCYLYEVVGIERKNDSQWIITERSMKNPNEPLNQRIMKGTTFVATRRANRTLLDTK